MDSPPLKGQTETWCTEDSMFDLRVTRRVLPLYGETPAGTAFAVPIALDTQPGLGRIDEAIAAPLDAY